MLNTLNDYLLLGIDMNGKGSDASGWSFFIATALIAALLLRRQSDD